MGKKYSIMALLDILKKYSDQEHILSVRDIITLMENEYGITLERRTVYANVRMLQEYGYDISDYEDNGSGYYLGSRDFDKGEVLLLCNAIHASHFISRRQSDALIKKLLDTQSVYEQNNFYDKVYLPNTLKTPNRQLMYNVETVSDAIRDHKLLQFIYLKYDMKGQLVPRRDDPYLVEPRYIVYAESRPYMIATNPKYQNFIHFRLDKMKDAIIREESFKSLPRGMDAYEYARNRLFMFSGDIHTLTLRCDNAIMDQMVDRFGSDLILVGYDDETFTIRIRTSDQGGRYLAQEFLDSMEILEPQKLRDEFYRTLKKAEKKYKK